MRIRISARKSDLARLQAYQVGKTLQQKFPEVRVEYQFRESLGDKNLTDPLWKIPEKGVFTEDFMQDLLKGDTDLVVHSWKDLPTEEKKETFIVATLPRADQRDLLLMKNSFLGLPALQIYSSSPRREFNLSSLIPELLPWTVNEIKFQSVRGNIQTRVKKLLEDENIQGLVLAKAAMDRLLSTTEAEFQPTQDFLRQALNELSWMVLPLSENPSAAAQGALAVEIRRDRQDLIDLFADINSQSTFEAAAFERKLLQNYGGGCHLALGMSQVTEADYAVTFVRGKTPRGDLVQKQEVKRVGQAKPPQFSSAELWSLGSEVVIRKKAELATKLDPQFGYVVSRAEAWPKSLTTEAAHYKIWTAGLKTWKRLAHLGVWVHGTFDSLGDQRPPQTEALWGPLKWKTLTHGGHPFLDLNKHVVTYETALPEFEIKNEKFFYWRSSSQFLEALNRYPQICERFHAAGPGSTLRTLREHLASDKIFVFINEQDWRLQCETKNS